MPGAELVGQPLAVARASRAPQGAAVQERVLDRKTGLPQADALCLGPGEVADVLDARAEAGRADHRAVAARKTALRDLVPARVFEVASEQVAQVAGLDRASHALSGTLDGSVGRGHVLRRHGSLGQLAQQLGPAGGSRPRAGAGRALQEPP